MSLKKVTPCQEEMSLGREIKNGKIMEEERKSIPMILSSISSTARIFRQTRMARQTKAKTKGTITTTDIQEEFKTSMTTIDQVATKVLLVLLI
mgnify:CR=1 FL=1